MLKTIDHEKIKSTYENIKKNLFSCKCKIHIVLNKFTSSSIISFKKLQFIKNNVNNN